MPEIGSRGASDPERDANASRGWTSDAGVFVLGAAPYIDAEMGNRGERRNYTGDLIVNNERLLIPFEIRCRTRIKVRIWSTWLSSTGRFYTVC